QVGVIAATARVPTSTSGVPVVTDALVGNNTSTEQTTVSAGADLIITLGAPLNIASGDFIDFDISVLNDGPNASSGFTIEFPIPTGVVNITGPAGGPLPSDCSIANDTVTCLISGTLANNATLLRSFQGQVSAAGGSTITSSASVLDTNPEDPDINNNTSVVDTSTDAGTDVEISIQQSGLPIVNVGDNSEFTIEAGYSGTSPQNLTITTEIPANYTLNAAGITTTAGWVCAVTPMTQEVTCTLPSGSITGVNVSLGQITIPTAVAVAGPTLVTAEITTGVGSPAETNFFNNTSQISATVTNRFIDLRANKVGPNPALAVVGNTYRYVLSTTNIGNVGFDGVLRMVDTLPQGMLVTSILDNGWSCTPSIPPSLAGPALLECELTYLPTAQLAPGDTTPQVRLGIEITESPPSGLLSNIMSVSSSNSNIVEDPSVLGNNTTTSIVETRDPNASADVGAVKTASRASLLAGEIQTFQIEVTNIGPGVASNIRVFDSLEGLINSDVGPTDAGVVSISEPAGFTCGTTIDSATVRELLCTTPSLAVCTPANGAVAGDCPIIEVSVRPGGAPGTRINTVSVRSLDTPDPDLSNRRSAVNYEVLPLTDVTVSKNATPTPAIAGQDVTFVITATNLDTLANGTITSLSDAENVTITDTLPDNVRFISATPSSGSCGTQPTSGAITNNSQVICNLGTLQSGAQRTVTIVLQPINILRGTTIINRVNVETTTAEIDDGLADADRNNSAEVSVPIENLEIDLLVNKEDSVDPVAVGDTTVYTLRVTNAGPSAAENVVVTDVLPDAIFAYRGHTISGAGVCGQVPVAQVTPHPSAALRTLECTFPYLAANASETVQITVEAVDQGTIPNTVSITSAEITAGFDREPENNTTTETTTARSRADVAVTSKVPSASNVSLREAFNFVITLENNPTSSGFEAAVVTLTDNLPTGMVLTGAPTAVITSGTSTLNSCTGVANDASFACQFGTISEDAVAQITVPVKVIAIASQNQLMENTAQVSTISFDNVVANNSSIGRVTVSGSSLAGTVYRDFNDSATAIANGIDEARDTGIVGVTMTVQGVAIDGQAINETTITNNDGEYSFAFLPAGTYSVTRGVVNEPSLITGQNTVGSTGGTITSGSQISSIALPATVAATGYDFAEVPQSSISSIALVKSADLSALSNPPQAGDIVTYNFRIRNTGNVTLNDVTLTDTVPGVMLSGSPIPTLLPGNENTTSYSATYALQPEDLDGQISNTAIVTGVAPDSSIVEDTSGTSLTNDTPTITGIPVTVFTPAPSISLNKTVDASEVLDGAEPGEMLTYGFVITNTGNVPLFDVTLSDNLAGLTLTGSPIEQLNVGESNSAAYTATYEITVNDLDAGRVVNTAVVEGAEVRGGAPVATDADTETVPLEVIDQQTEEIIEAIPEVFPPFEDGGSTTSVLTSDLLNGNPATFDTVTITVIREDDGVTLDPTTGIL
ncbi:MAG: SdrD B-like domain-containing protein, partial [Pseudomonadota bacterium]